ncbi:hypothetical protein MOD31_00175 [Paenarthrobacter sp. TYUT067]|nr:hypothetical protein [Paenarthrobacter sp. TYUT067]MCM0614432.1 hypothetical protein [Paenarthrobacter sp. TYUT067]
MTVDDPGTVTLAWGESQVGPPESADGDTLNVPANRLGETLVQPSRGDVVIESGHRDAAVWLPPGDRSEECESYPSSPSEGNYCNQLNEQRIRIGSTREHTTNADRIVSDLCQQNELLPNLRHVVLDRLNVGGLAVCLHPSHPATVLRRLICLADQDF